jgi:phage terminase large subunit-like protein
VLADATLRHNGNAVLRWMAGNVAGKTDPAGNVKPDKAKSGDKIDGIVALIMGLGRAASTAAAMPSLTLI